MTASKRVFVVHAPIRDIRQFEKLAKLSTKLKPYGRVEVNVSNLAEKSTFEVPEGGSPWHEYASYNPTPHKFFPPKLVKPFLPAEHVRRNREMLKKKVDVLKKLKLGAAFWSYEPNFLPEEFFREHPRLRGARTDHPRRSCKEAFALCVDLPESQDLIAESLEGLAKAVPMLGTFFFKTNDAGPALCWSDWGYSGPNGPSHCRHRNMGERVRGLLDAFNRGAKAGGLEIDLHMSGNFMGREYDDIARNLPANATLLRRTKRTSSISSGISSHYPIKGLLNPLDVLKQLQRLKDDELTTVFVDFRSSYDRGYDDLETAERLFWMIDDFIKGPAYGTLATMNKLMSWCREWAGKKADALFEALVSFDEAMKFKRAAVGRLSPIYCGVSARYMTRPLVAMPEKLTPEEESYFLPYVFNIHENEGRMDYIDIHGGRLGLRETPDDDGADPRVYDIDAFRQMVDKVCATLENLDGARDAKYFAKVAASLRIYASMMRSGNNFWSMQKLRDRNAAKLSGPERIPAKVGTMTGDADLLLMFEFMRDELDNAADLLDLLENRGGMDRICVAAPGEDEDTFLLGPDVPDQLRRKMKIMRDHWLDATKHLATPHK